MADAVGFLCGNAGQLGFQKSHNNRHKRHLNFIQVAIVLDSAPAEDAMRKGKPVQEVGVFGSDEFGVAIRKDDAETMKLVNEGYKLLKADPYWKELQAKYLGNK